MPIGDGIEQSDDDYLAGKLDFRGYPGVTASSLAMNDTQGRHICDWCLNPYNPAMVHDCYEKRNGIKLSEQKTLADGTTPKAHYGHGCSVDPAKALEVTNEPAVWIERIKNDALTYEIRNIPNEQALRVISVVLPKAIELYLKKSKDYGGNVMQQIDLGPKACIPDMQRKFGKIVNAIWWDKPLQFEQPDEILMDLLGHIFIILDEMRKDKHADVLYRIEEEE